ncbi:hypothetical protein CR513_23403, partial [Mucuna pruriens]
MKRTFLEKFFSASRTVSIQKEICGIRQHIGETLHEIRRPSQSRMVNEIDATSNQRLENQLTELTSLVRQLVIGKHQPAMAAKVCGIYTFVEHLTNMCPTLQEFELDQPENVGAIGGFQYGKQPYQIQPFDRALCSSTIRVHTEYISETSRLSTADSTISSATFPTTTVAAESAYSRVPVVYELQQNVTATIQDLNVQIGQLANTTSPLQSAGSSNLPSQTIPNPRGNANLPRSAVVDSEPNSDSQSRPKKTAPVPFLSWIISARRPESDEELLKMF